MSGAAQDGPAGQGPPQSVLDALDASQRAFDALRTELLAMQAQVQAVEARTGQLEQFVEGLKPGAGGGEQHSEALRQLRELWQADNERALATLRCKDQLVPRHFALLELAAALLRHQVCALWSISHGVSRDISARRPFSPPFGRQPAN